MYIVFDKVQDLLRINFSDAPTEEFERLHQSMSTELLLGENNKLIALLVHSCSEVKAAFKSLLKEDGFLKELPDEAIVFYDHQGYQFYFLLQEEAPYYVYTYLEGQSETGFTRLEDELPSFLIKLLSFDYGVKAVEV